MTHSASENYLANEVMTAAPQKLHLMLLDAAIREGELARKHWQAGENEKAGKRLMHAQKIIYGIIDGIDYKTKSTLVGKVAGVYLFIYASLTRAYIDNNEEKLAEALRILAIERETWRQLCEKLTASSSDQTPPQTNHAPLAPHLLSNGGTVPDSSASSFSLEA